MDKSVKPRQLSQLMRPLLRDLAYKADALIQTVEITSWFQILVKIFLSPKDALGVSVFGNSA